MRGKWPLAAGLVLLMAVVGGLITVSRTNFSQRKQSPPAVQPAPPSPKEVVLDGPVEARKVVNIPASTEGVIVRFMVNAGDPVFEGELLAQIRNPKLDSAAQAATADAEQAQAHVADLENALLGARLEASRSRSDETRVKAELERAERFYTQQKALIEQGATPRLTFEKAEKDYNTYKADSENLGRTAAAAEDRVTSLTAELEQARKEAEAKSQRADESKAELGAGEVHSTVDGVVLARRGDTGAKVGREMPDLFQIGADLGNLQVTVTPDSQLLSRIRAGQPAALQIAEAPGPIQGVIRAIDAGKVIVDFTSPSPTIKPGQTAKVRIILLDNAPPGAATVF